MNWQPMSTAPKAGQLILAYLPTMYRSTGGMEVVVWHNDGWYVQMGLRVWPSHWMLLPDKPITTNTGVES